MAKKPIIKGKLINRFTGLTIRRRVGANIGRVHHHTAPSVSPTLTILPPVVDTHVHHHPAAEFTKASE